jgi:hypothetical protein
MTGMEMLAHRFTCPRCGAAPGARCTDVAAVLHVERVDTARASIAAEHGPQLMPGQCPRCAQMSDVAGVCQACRGLERVPQGEAVRLFTPAPTEIPGQLAL